MALILVVFILIVMAVMLIIFKSRQFDESYLYYATGVVSNIDLEKKEITLTEIEYGDGKTLNKLILLTEDVDLYDNDEERISLNDINTYQNIKFYYFDTEEYLLKENAKVKPHSIYDLSK